MRTFQQCVDDSNADLLPCPFCGGEPKFFVSQSSNCITCPNCGCQSGTVMCISNQDPAIEQAVIHAVKLWNMRAHHG